MCQVSDFGDPPKTNARGHHKLRRNGRDAPRAAAAGTERRPHPRRRSGLRRSFGLAASSVRFDPFCSNSPVCSPTRAALLTGRYPDVAGVPGVIRTDPANSWGYLAANAELLPKRLHSVGYHSAIVGKWHLGLESPNLPNQRGFDLFHGFLGDMMDDYYTHRRHARNYMRLNDREIDPQGHATDLFTDWAIEYLKSRPGQAQPFFLYLAYNALCGPPHASTLAANLGQVIFPAAPKSLGEIRSSETRLDASGTA